LDGYAVATTEPHRGQRGGYLIPVWKWLLVIGGVGAALGFLLFATLHQATVRCEACVGFEGRRACRSAAAGSVEDARRMAVSTACATIAAGVTQTLACERGVPEQLRCDAPDDGGASGE